MPAPSNKSADPGSAFTIYRNLFLVLAAFTVALQMATLGPLRGSAWGLDLYAYVPVAISILFWCLLAAAAILILVWGWQPPALSSAWHKRPVLVTVGVTVVATLFFWIFKSEQILLGDGVPLTIDLPQGVASHPRQPLTMWLQQQFYQATNAWFQQEGRIPPYVARRTVALGSVIAGCLFVPVARALGSLLGGNGKGIGGWLAALVLLTQGYAIFFFGYVENYTYYTLFIGLYLLTALLYLHGRMPLYVCSLALATSTGLHLSALSLYPSFFFLVIWGVRRKDERFDALMGLGVFVAWLFVLNWVVGLFTPDFNLFESWRQMKTTATTSQGGSVGLKYTFSAVHLRDFLNGQFLLGPLAAFLFIPGLLIALVRRQMGSAVGWFLTLASAMFLAGSFAMSEPLLGYPRDWDLFAPAGVCYCAAGIYFMRVTVAEDAGRNRLLLFATIFSFLQLTAFVMVNHSESRTVERFKHLPLGEGRTEVVVGNHYMREGDSQQAEFWFREALRKNPYNANGHAFLARIYEERERWDLAADAMKLAVMLRKDKVLFRRRYITDLLLAKRCDTAAEELAWLAAKEPTRYDYWYQMGDSLISQGCEDKLPEVYAPVLASVMAYLSENPRSELQHVNAGILLAKLDRLEESTEHFRAAMSINPNSVPAAFNLGWSLVRLNRVAESLPYFRKFLSMAPDHPMAAYAREIVTQHQP